MSIGRHMTSGLSAMDAGIDDVAFARLAAILHSECGIVLSDSKKSLAVSRLSKRLRQVGASDFSQYCDLLESRSGEAERKEMVCLLTTNVTNFFREAHHFQRLSEEVLPTLLDRARKGERVRMWSAGCSSGQEPYSIAMTVLDAMPDAGRLDLRILATDIDSRMISTGKSGIYRDLEKAQVTEAQRRSYFSKDADGTGNWQARDHLRDLITFAELNLIGDWPMKGPFDVIFCRNVVIYFDADTQARLWSRFSKLLAPDGNLFVGHSERVSGPAASQLKLVGTTQYKKI